ncbi:MAG: ACT domain-containing protein [Bacteroidales bacterium]|nr:acetolactate synthase [Bacteroidales bacterium]HOK99523.1 acetolactate synthase [Bacteroidales bacterium]HPO66096.1 acetolactate synthase [Bacteroidales bacterium]
MSIKQLSIFLENKSGRLNEVLDVLGEKKINIAALSVADTSEYGILRLIVSDPVEAVNLLKNKNFSVNLTDVIGLETPPEAGSLAKILKPFAEANISIEYMYAFTMKDKGIVVMRTSNRQLAFKIIEEKKLKIITLEEIFKF